MWPLRSPHWPNSQGTLMVNHFIDQNGYIWVGDGRTSRIIKFDLQGNYLYSWGAPGPQPGRLGCSHGITSDQLGNLYLADCFAGLVQKFAPIPGADPEKLAGQIPRTWDTWKRNRSFFCLLPLSDIFQALARHDRGATRSCRGRVVGSDSPRDGRSRYAVADADGARLDHRSATWNSALHVCGPQCRTMCPWSFPAATTAAPNGRDASPFCE